METSKESYGDISPTGSSSKKRGKSIDGKHSGDKDEVITDPSPTLLDKLDQEVLDTTAAKEYVSLGLQEESSSTMSA